MLELVDVVRNLPIVLIFPVIETYIAVATIANITRPINSFLVSLNLIIINTRFKIASTNTALLPERKIPASKIGNDTKLLKENLEVYITSYEGEILGIDLPDKVELVITHTEPAVKGNTTNSAMKDAECETGLMVKVPLFIEEGETIIVSTADSKYVSRA